jgi:hypothetical protein
MIDQQPISQDPEKLRKRARAELARSSGGGWSAPAYAGSKTHSSVVRALIPDDIETAVAVRMARRSIVYHCDRTFAMVFEESCSAPESATRR